MNRFFVNSVFLRVYAGILAAVVGVVLLALLSLQLINQVRFEQYREALARGPFTLLAQRIEQVPAAERAAWLAQAQRMMGMELALQPLAQVSLEPLQVQRLLRGDTLVRPHPVGGMAVYRLLPDATTLLQGRLQQVTELQARGVVELIGQTLRQAPPAYQQGRAAALSELFGYPIQVLAQVPPLLDRVQRQRLQQQEVVMVFDPDANAISAYRLLQPERLLQVGPVQLLNPYPITLLTGVALLALLIVGLAIYLFVHALERRLQKLERAATRIAGGNLDARVVTSGGDFVSRLGQAFNAMADQVLRLLQAQREMIHAVSHELRTPVARLRFGLQMIEDSVEDEFCRAQLKGMDNDIDELDELIDEILTYARLGDSKLQMEFQQVEVDALLEAVIDNHRLLRPELELTLECRQQGQQCQAVVEPRYLQRAVQNLVGNACRYAQRQIRVECQVDADSIRIDVEDDGPGIPPQDWDRVFAPFTRLDDSRARKSGGYGLGLSIVRRITQWHSGSALVDRSEALGGARFSLVWPRWQEEGAGVRIQPFFD